MYVVGAEGRLLRLGSAPHQLLDHRELDRFLIESALVRDLVESLLEFFVIGRDYLVIAIVSSIGIVLVIGRSLVTA